MSKNDSLYFQYDEETSITPLKNILLLANIIRMIKLKNNPQLSQIYSGISIAPL